MAYFVTHDAQGKILQKGSCSDGTVHLQGVGMGVSIEVESTAGISLETHWVESGEIAARPETAPLVPGSLPWAIPQSDGETVTVQNEVGDIVESDDYLDPVIITEEGTYRVTVDAGWPSIAWVGDVTLA